VCERERKRERERERRENALDRPACFKNQNFEHANFTHSTTSWATGITKDLAERFTVVYLVINKNLR
jgi:hypothetical protein